jgi:FkbM family methyltransferase
MAEFLAHVVRLRFKPHTVIDVGVANGTPALYRAFPRSKHLLVEPLQEFEPVLQQICAKHDGTYVLAAAHEKPGKLIIHVHAEMLHSSTAFRESDGVQVDGLPREVAAITLDNVAAEHSLPGPYVIKVDVQGAELLVLRGASKVMQEAELIILEVSLFQFYIGGAEFFDVVNFMKRAGFVVYDLFDGHCRPSDGALAQVDVAFVKERGFFRQHHRYASEAQRKTITAFHRFLKAAWHAGS